MNDPTTCEVCGRIDSWGCGHTGAQRWYARRHFATQKHAEGRCECRTVTILQWADQHREAKRRG